MKPFLVVNEAVGEIRGKPEHSAEQVSQVVLGSVLRVLGSRDGVAVPGFCGRREPRRASGEEHGGYDDA